MSVQIYRSWLPGGSVVITAVLACDRCNTLSETTEQVRHPAGLLVVRNRLRIRGRYFCGWSARSAFDRESGRNSVIDICPDCRRRESAQAKGRPWRRWK